MTREKQPRLWTIVVVLVGVAVLLAAGVWVIAAKKPSREATDLPYIPLAIDKSLGVNVALSRLEPAQIEEVLASVAEGGFRWVRQRFAWDQIEPQNGTYDWEIWDAIVSAATRHDLQLLVVLDGSPDWARADKDAMNPLAPPLETRDYGAFASAVANRYQESVDYYQVWDEPNIAPHWGARSVDPAEYARLLREAAIQIRATDREALILLAALAPNVETGGTNLSELDFLDRLYQEGAGEWFDVVAAQPYDFGENLDAPSRPDTLIWRRVELLRDVMERHGDISTAVWAVAWGVSAASPQSLDLALEQSRQEWPWLGPMIWAAWSSDQPHGEYALIAEDGAFGQWYEALRRVATEPLMAWPGVYPANHPSGSYEGDWRVTEWGADIGQTGDRLEILFAGTRLDLAVRRGDYRAFLWVTVDGQPGNALPRDAQGRAYVVLYDPLQQVDTVTLASNLADSQHEAQLIAERGWGQWAVVGWTSSRPQPRRTPWVSAGLALALAWVLGFVAYRAWPERQRIIRAVAVPVNWYRNLDDRFALAATAGAAALLYIMTGTVPVLVALALLAGLLLMRPQMGLPLVAFALPFYQPGRPILGKVFSLVEILTLLTALGWLANVTIGALADSVGAGVPSLLSEASRRARRLTVLDWGVVALVVLAALSLSWAEHTRVAVREFRTVIFEAAMFYALLRAMLSGQPHRSGSEAGYWRVVDAWVLGGMLISLVGLVQAILGQNLVSLDEVSRVRGFYGSPNNLALYLGRIFPLVLALLLWGRTSWRRWVYGTAAALMAGMLFLTYSRGAWVVGLPISILFLAALRRRRALAVTALVVAAALSLVLLLTGPGRLASLLNATEGTTYFRIQLWQSSLAMLKDHPVLGVGLDNFLYHYRTHYVLPTAWEEFNLSHPHNLLLDSWLRLGLPGLAVFLWLLVGFFGTGMHRFRRMPQGNNRILLQGIMAGMVYMVAHGLVDNAFFLVDLAFAFMLMLVLVQIITPANDNDTESL